MLTSGALKGERPEGLGRGQAGETADHEGGATGLQPWEPSSLRLLAASPGPQGGENPQWPQPGEGQA